MHVNLSRGKRKEKRINTFLYLFFFFFAVFLLSPIFPSEKNFGRRRNFLCILYFFFFLFYFLVCSYFPNRKLMDYPQVAVGWVGEKTLWLDFAMLFDDVTKFNMWNSPSDMSPGDTSRLMGAAVLYNPHPTETFSLSKIPLPLKLAGPSKKWEGKIPQRSPCYHLSWYFREWLLILLASGQWIFRLYLFIRPSFFFLFLLMSSHRPEP